ncbi:MAG: hypothetical protein ACRDYY_07100 [Acidimicrobiales bacterium]
MPPTPVRRPAAAPRRAVSLDEAAAQARSLPSAASLGQPGKKGVLQPDLARQALDAVELIATLRLRAHLDAMEQHDELRATPSDGEGADAALSGEEPTKVQAIITTLLPALGAALGAAAQRAVA